MYVDLMDRSGRSRISQREPIILANFPKKLHENEKKLDLGGG